MLQQTHLVKNLKPKRTTTRLAGWKKWDTLVFALTAPVIGSPMWADIITKDQMANVKIERLKAVMKGEYDTATDYEALLYLSTASLDTPLSTCFFHIYCHLFKKHYPDKSDFLSEHDTQLDKFVEPSELKRLKDWIFRKQKQHLKERENMEKTNSCSTDRNPQSSLFDFTKKGSKCKSLRPIRR